MLLSRKHEAFYAEDDCPLLHMFRYSPCNISCSVWVKVSSHLVSFPGPEPTLFGKPKFSCMRLHYKYKDTSGYFHTLRAVVRNPDEDGKGLFPM